MLGKKGISPLISTILLIALAVALGTFIMNWGSGNVQAAGGTCNDTSLTVQKAFGKDILCYDVARGTLKVIVKNSGNSVIDGLVYRRILPDFTTRDLDVPDSKIRQGSILETNIGYQRTDRVHIEIIPKLMTDKGPILCTDKAIIRESIENCPEQ